MINGQEKRKAFPAFSYFLLQLRIGIECATDCGVTSKNSDLVHTINRGLTGDDLRFLSSDAIPIGVAQ